MLALKVQVGLCRAVLLPLLLSIPCSPPSCIFGEELRVDALDPYVRPVQIRVKPELDFPAPLSHPGHTPRLRG